MSHNLLIGKVLVRGTASGTVLRTDTALSFWGGVNPSSGEIIDHHHPLKGQNVAGKILALPSGRGSCTGSSVLLELIFNDLAPAAIIFCEREEILTLGVVVAEQMFGQSLPVVQLEQVEFQRLNPNSVVHIDNGVITVHSNPQPSNRLQRLSDTPLTATNTMSLSLTPMDHDLLNGVHGRAAQAAMQVIIRMAQIQGADTLVSVTQAHIDGCVYNGPSSLVFAKQLVDWGAQVRVPTTLNSISVDQQRWQLQGVDPAFAVPASELGDAYIQMGAQLSFTCAPYLLDSAPALGEHIVWAESNAVVYANSVLGARTHKYADFLDICIALTARAPLSGCHLSAERLPAIAIVVEAPTNPDDSFWPLLGYHLGLLAVNDLPIIYGLNHTNPTSDNLKAFSAAFATTSSCAMFHLAGVTPEAESAHQYWESAAPAGPVQRVTRNELLNSWKQLNTATDSQVDIVCLGNPHFSLSECKLLADLCSGRRKHQRVSVYVTLGRSVYESAVNAGYINDLEQFGIEFITDTCWCMLGQPIIPASAQVLITNSGKYAHYAPGLVSKSIYFDSLANCVEAGCKGTHISGVPDWLQTE